MLWLLMALLVILAGIMMMRRKADYDRAEDEPWRQSLKEDDEPLDVDEVRKAEEEWLDTSGWEDSDDEGWR